MSETLAPTNPETEKGYENELVAGFAELADLSVDVLKRSREEHRVAYEATGDSSSVFTGVSLEDIEGFMARRNPDADIEEIQVKAAQLFNRIAMETHDMPEPDDLSHLDTSSHTARMDESDVLAYAIAHAKDHMENIDTDSTSSSLEEDKIANFTNTVGRDEKYHHDDIKKRMLKMGFARNASKYPNVPDYIQTLQPLLKNE